MYQHRGYDSYPGNAASLQGSQYHHTPQYTRGLSNNPVVLDDYNSDLNFLIEGDGFTGSSLYKDGFEYLWAGARATYGVRNGKACFEVIILEKLPVSMPDSERNPHVARVGWSADSSSLIVGEDKLSYGYGGTGKSSLNNKFFDYGHPYTVNDVLSCYIDFDEKCIFFAKNGLYLGKAFDLSRETAGIEFFPHVTVKNMKVQVNFGYSAPFVPPITGFTMIEHLPKNMLIRGTRGPDTRRDCQVIMMVGLPGCGKTVWANKYALDNKDMKVNILGTNTIMDRMKVTGLTRQRNYHGRWDQLIKQASNVLNQMFKIANNKNRNYIIDQTNVYPGARKKKMASFHGYKRVAAVIVNSNEVLRQRTEKREREEGKNVPEKAIMQMKKNFTLPEIGESFDAVWFIEEDQQTSIQMVEVFRMEGREFEEREAEQEREEMKRKRETPSPCGEPPAKEAYHPSNEGRHPPATHYPPHGTHDASRYLPRGHGLHEAASPYSPRGHGTHEQFLPRFPSRNYGNPELSARQNPQYPPRPQVSHDPYGAPYGYGALSRPPQTQDYYAAYEQQTRYTNYNPSGRGYESLPYSQQCSESRGGGCSQYESFVCQQGRQPQENEYRGHPHHYGNAHGKQNYYSGGY